MTIRHTAKNANYIEFLMRGEPKFVPFRGFIPSIVFIKIYLN